MSPEHSGNGASFSTFPRHISSIPAKSAFGAGIQSRFSTARLAGNCKSRSSRSKALAESGQQAPFEKKAGAALLVEDALTNLSSPRRSAGFARQIGFAVALASGTALLAVPGFTGAAYAQKKKKDEKKAEAAPAYSKAFVDAYTPIDAALKVPGANAASIKLQILALVPLAVSPDEQLALGGMMYNAGISSKDTALHLQGAELMLGSGKVKPEDAGRFTFTAYQLATELKQYDKARSFLQKAIDMNFTSASTTKSDLELGMAELYFAQNQHVEGLKFLADAIAARKAQGLAVDEKWYRRGVSIAYTNEVVPQVYDFVLGWVSSYPTPANWRDSVNLTRNLNEFEPPVMLDLLRLGKRVGTLKEKNDYIFYIEAADTRRLPNEVKQVIEEANASGVIAKGSDSWVDEQLKAASGLIAEDRAALPVLERDANKPAAQLRTILAAGEAFLSYGEYAKAAGFYERALTMPGADLNLVLTRLGIAQIGQGNTDAARENLAKVEGARVPVAMLWSAYAAQLSASVPAPAAAGA